MKWRVRKPGVRARLRNFEYLRYKRRLARWTLWFAWYPVRVPTNGKMSGMTKVWWEPVERRRRVYMSLCIIYSDPWEYRSISQKRSK